MWRKFQFFEKAIVNDYKLTQFSEEHDITCCSSGRGQIIFGDNKGDVHVMDRALNTRKCLAHEKRVNHIQHVPSKNFLVTVGDDGGEAFHDSLKIFNLNQYDPKNGSFMQMRSELVFPKTQKPTLGKLSVFNTVDNSIQPSPVTCLQVNKSFTTIALGTGDGHIILFMGELERPNSKIVRKVLNGVGEDHGRITGLKWGTLTNQLEDTDEWEILYVSTIDHVFSYRIGKRGQIDNVVLLDEDGGCESGCSTMSNEGDMVTATKTGIWFYKPEGKAGCFAFEGKKIMIEWFRTYLVVVSTDVNVKNNSVQQTVTIYDLKNKFIAFKFSSDRMQISHILQEWGSLFILATEPSDESMQQTMYLLEEKDTQTKLEMLFQKNLYTIAISLVNSQQLDYTYVVEIFRKYGDHLYQKKDYDNAMAQYLRTIGKLEPSYIIRKFLDAQRIGNLTTYLEALHEKNLATSDHTTLLLNCYTKLKGAKKDKLDKFIQEHANLHYDVETAIRVCRSSGYKEHALLLAKDHGEHDWFLKITIEDFPEDQLGANYRRALRHIETLPFEEAEKYMQVYGKILVTKLPKHSTNMLIRLCTDYFPISPQVVNRSLLQNASQTRANIKKQESKVSEQLSQMSANEKKSGQFGLDFFGLGGSRKQATSNADPSSIDIRDDHSGKKSSAENFIHAYSSQPYWLMVFLENVILRNAIGVDSISKSVYNTLIELYLQYLEKDKEEVEMMNNVDKVDDEESSSGVLPIQTRAANGLPNEMEYIYDITPPNEQFASLSYKNRCLEILENQESNIDSEHVLVMVQSANFKDGVLKLYERLHLHYDIIQHHMDQKDYENIISQCIKYGHTDSNLWVQVLNYFATYDDDNVDFNDYISRVLQKIETDNIIPPLVVVQILSKQSSKTKLSTIRDFLTTKIAQEQILMKEDEEKIREYQTDTKNMKKEVFTLRTSAKIFQLTTCSYCGQQLDLPAVHFMCGHSYHQRCCSTNIEMDDGESCPKCHKKNLEILQRKQKYEESSDQHEQFFKQLNKNADGFSVVAEYLGRNMFSMIQMDADDRFSENDLYEDDDDFEEDYTETLDDASQ